MIKKLSTVQEIDQCAAVLRAANATVAKELGFTPENAPTNPAFITAEVLGKALAEKEIELFGLFKEDSLVGCVALERAPKEKDVFYLERLAVVPEFRNRGLGKQLMDFSFNRAAELSGVKISIGIINENSRLKKWYGDYGFTETGIREFDHLPFSVCFMEKAV